MAKSTKDKTRENIEGYGKLIKKNKKANNVKSFLAGGSLMAMIYATLVSGIGSTTEKYDSNPSTQKEATIEQPLKSKDEQELFGSSFIVEYDGMIATVDRLAEFDMKGLNVTPEAKTWNYSTIDENASWKIIGTELRQEKEEVEKILNDSSLSDEEKEEKIEEIRSRSQYLNIGSEYISSRENIWHSINITSNGIISYKEADQIDDTLGMEYSFDELEVALENFGIDPYDLSTLEDFEVSSLEGMEFTFVATEGEIQDGELQLESGDTTHVFELEYTKEKVKQITTNKNEQTQQEEEENEDENDDENEDKDDEEKQKTPAEEEHEDLGGPGVNPEVVDVITDDEVEDTTVIEDEEVVIVDDEEVVIVDDEVTEITDNTVVVIDDETFVISNYEDDSAVVDNQNKGIDGELAIDNYEEVKYGETGYVDITVTQSEVVDLSHSDISTKEVIEIDNAMNNIANIDVEAEDIFENVFEDVITLDEESGDIIVTIELEESETVETEVAEAETVEVVIE